MPIDHIHLKQTESTQTELKKLVSLPNKKNSQLLVSCDQQIAGRGRQGSQWRHYQHALAFSFTLAPSPVITLTPLEIGVHLANYFKSNLRLKWPNDLLNDKKEKVGGIICQLYHDIILVGIGLNLYLSPDDLETSHFPYPIGGLTQENHFTHEDKRTLPQLIYTSILNNRLSTQSIKEQWSDHCFHLNHEVLVIDGDQNHQGIFIGLGDRGEAILEDREGKQVKVLTGSLRIQKTIS